MNRRPRLLFLAYRFPPSQAISCVRTWNIAKYLSRLGWDVTVVTPDRSWIREFANNATIADELCDAGIRRILTDHKWRILLENYWKGVLGSLTTRVCRRVARYLDIEPSVGWLKEAEDACNQMNCDDVDVVLASGPPFGTFCCAERLARRLRCPYVLDYRDPWTGSPHAGHQPPPKSVARERELIGGSAAVTIVSPSWASAMDRRFDVGSKLHVVTNGYDPEELDRLHPHSFGHFALVYTGIFYPPKRVITPVMAALQRLDRAETKAKPWKFHYYGPHSSHVRDEAERFGVTKHVLLHNVLPRREALSAVQGANVSVVINSIIDHGTLDDRGHIPAKIFEPLGLGKSILLVTPEGSDACDIIENHSNARSLAGNDIEGIARFLLELMRNAAVQASCFNDRYSWPILALRLDDILKRAVDRPLAPTNSYVGLAGASNMETAR